MSFKRLLIITILVGILVPAVNVFAEGEDDNTKKTVGSLPSVPEILETIGKATTPEDTEAPAEWSGPIKLVIVFTALALIPSMLVMMTSFTRIVIVLAILRQAVGLMQAPSSQTLVGLALFLTFFIMAPVFNKINNVALQPYLAEKMSPQDAVVKAADPLRDFMMGQTREADISMFSKIAGDDVYDKPADVPFTVLVPAFVTSELKTAFQIGFLLLTVV